MTAVGWVERSDTYQCRWLWRWVSLRSTHPTKQLLFHAGFMWRELVDRRAELAGHHHLVVFHHLSAVFRRKAFQHGRHRLARAGALRAQRQRREDAYAAFVKQPVQQALARQIGIDQLDILDGADQRLALDPGIILGN